MGSEDATVEQTGNAASELAGLAPGELKQWLPLRNQFGPVAVLVCIVFQLLAPGCLRGSSCSNPVSSI